MLEGEPFLTNNEKGEKTLYGPFKTGTWEEWLEMQAHMFQWFSRFQHAIEHKRPGEPMKIVLQMQDTVMIWTREANEWIDM